MLNKIATLTIAAVLGTSPISAKAFAAAQVASKSVTPSKIALRPIFSVPTETKSAITVFLASRNPSIVATMDWSPSANAARMREIQQIAKNYKLQKPGSQTALPLGESLLKLLIEHAYYLDNLRAYGMADREFPNVEAGIRTAHGAVAAHAEMLVKQFPRAAQAAQWKAEAAISRLRTNSPNGPKDAMQYTRSNKGADAARVQALGILLDRVKGASGSPFGSLDKSLTLETDNLTKAVLTLFAADGNQNKKLALTNYQDAARLALPFRGPNGNVNPIVQRSVAQTVSISVQQNANSIDPEILSFLQSMGNNSAGHYYAEQIALQTAAKQPRQAIAFYQSIVDQPGISAQQVLYIEHRGVEISLNSNDCESADSQWDRAAKLPNTMTVTGAQDRITRTQNLCWSAVEKSATASNVDRFVRLHDLFVTLSPVYAKNDDWKLRVVDGLFRSKNDAAAATRADALAASSSKPAMQIAALRFAAKARERIIGIPARPDFKTTRKIENEIVAGAYVGTLDKIGKLGTTEEKQNAAFQAAFILHQMENIDVARKRFESAMAAHAKTNFAAESASYLLEINLAKRDHIYTERIARLTEKLRIKPSNKSHADLRKIIENSVWEQATALAENSQYEAAAARYVAFQKEFANTKRADTALDLAAKNYLKAQKVDAAITQMEALLSAYPKSSYAKETRWTAAEQSKGIGQHQRSATHYEEFNNSWPSEGLSRKAMFKAAEMQKAAGRYAHSATDFEKYLNQTSSKPERVKTTKEIAMLHIQFGKASDAIGGLERVVKVSGSADDEFWARSQIFEVQLRQGQSALIRAAASKLVSLPPSGDQGSRMQARAKFELGKLDAAEARAMEPMNNPKLLKATQDLLKQYEKAKTNLSGPCGGALPEWCSVAFYEISRLAEDVAKILLDVEPPPTLNPKEADQIQSVKVSGGEKLTKEVKSYSEQAESAIAGGVPDQDWADRIRQWGQNQRGENQTVEPMYK